MRRWYIFLLVPLIVYIKGLAPTVVLGDTGDYQTAGWIWGVAHPPGYPLYTVLVGIIERLPIPPVWIQTASFSLPAWRANVLSALFALGALAALFALVNRLTKRPIVALLASGALAFSRVFWWHAEICENDTLSAMLILLILLMAVRWVQDRRRWDPYILAFLIGIGISHHQIVLMFLPAVLVFLLMNRSLRFTAKQWVAFALLFALGLTPFVYLPLVRYKTPEGPIKFVSESEYAQLYSEDQQGSPTVQYKTDSPSRFFFNYVFRTIYGRQRQYTHASDMLRGDVTGTSDILAFYGRLVRDDFGWLFVLAGLVGLALGYGIRNRSPNGKEAGANPTAVSNWVLLIVAFFVYFLLVHFYPSGDILNAPRYNLETAGPGLMLPLEILWAVFIGLGIARIMDWLETLGKSARIIDIAVLAIGISTIALVGVTNFPYTDKSHNTLAHEYILNALDSCPENSVLVVAGDELYAFWYMHNVHPDSSVGGDGYRRDVRLVGWSGELESLSELGDISKAMTSALVRVSRADPSREIDMTFFNSQFLQNEELRRYIFVRRGIVFALVPPDRVAGLAETSDELTEQTGVAKYEAALPTRYRWGYYERNSRYTQMAPEAIGKRKVKLWPPEEDIKWRTAEMLLFYGTDALLKGGKTYARDYFSRMVLVEPENPRARTYLEMANEGS